MGCLKLPIHPNTESCLKVVHQSAAGGYRYGYQGSEMDNEVSGNGNSYTTEFRQLDPRLGRWFSPDPVFQPWQSPYTSMDNDPINLNDVLGDKVGDKKDVTVGDKVYTQEEISEADYDENNPSHIKMDFTYGNTKYFKLTEKGASGSSGGSSEGDRMSISGNYVYHWKWNDTWMNMSYDRSYTYHEGGALYGAGWYDENTYELTQLDQEGGQLLPSMNDLEMAWYGMNNAFNPRYVVLQNYGASVLVVLVNQEGYVGAIPYFMHIVNPDVESLVRLPLEIAMGNYLFKALTAYKAVSGLSLFEGLVLKGRELTKGQGQLGALLRWGQVQGRNYDEVAAITMKFTGKLDKSAVNLLKRLGYTRADFLKLETQFMENAELLLNKGKNAAIPTSRLESVRKILSLW